MSLFEELIEDREEDEKIVKSFEPKDSLSDQIFEGSDGKFSMRDDIRKRLVEISNDFIESFGVEFFIHDVTLTGSLSNYNWSRYSDVDLHIIIDFDETEYPMNLVKEFFDAKERVWNEKHDIKIKGFDVEVYVQDLKQEHVSSGVYSILHNKWLIEPERNEPNIDDRMILQKGEHYAKQIDSLIKKSNKTNVLQMIDDLRKKIKTFRQSGLEQGGEYSYENLTFKLLRRNGYFGKLIKLKKDITDKKLSITQ
jgi:hypothetical protein